MGPGLLDGCRGNGGARDGGPVWCARCRDSRRPIRSRASARGGSGVMISRRNFLAALPAAGVLGGADDLTHVRIDAGEIIARVNPMIFGQFIEHLGRCIYGGIYEESSPLSDARGFRKDVLAAVKRLHPPVLRWPGGNFVSSYHWEDGIGPKDQRPRRFDTAWFAVEPNRFGTNEFIEYCRVIDTEPYICVNLGT